MGVLATNLNLTPKATLPELIERADNLDPYLFQNALTPAGGNLQVIPRPAGVMPAGWLSRRRMDKVMELARRHADVVVLDVPPSFDALQFELVNAADHAVLICQQSIAAVRALRRLLDSLGEARAGGTHLVLNMFDPAVKGLSVEDIQRAMGTTGFRPVPRDTAGLLAAVNHGQPLRDAAPNSPVLKAVAALVTQMLGEPAGGRAAETGLFSRFFHALRS
jgi:pilus assembly protein CpaE